MQLRQLQEAEEAAKYPHDMYDPETGEKEVANSEAEHKALAAKGYTHEKPEDDLNESFEEAMVDLEEARIKASDYEATSEKSKFGGHRAKVVHKTKGHTMWLGAAGFKTPKAAKAAADAYLSGYAIGSEKGAQRMLDAHIRNNKKNLVDPSVLDEAVALSEEIRFKAGDMPNSDLLNAIEKLKGLKAKAEGEKKKFSDPTLIDSVEQLIIGLEMGVKAGEKAEKQASKFIAQAASVMNKAFALAKRKQHLLNSFEAEGDQLDEAFNIEKGTNVKMKAGSDKDLYGTVIKQVKVNGKPAVTVQWKNGVKGNFRMDQFAAVSMDRKADYQVKDDGVRFDQKESVELDEAYQQFTDKTPNWGEDQAITFGRKKGYKEVAVMSDNNSKHPMVLFALDSGDKNYIKGSNVKSGETVFRYATKISIAGDIFPLVKVNIAKGIYYNLTQESSEGTIEDAKFENKGVKLKFFRSLEGAIKESVELDEAKFGDNDLVHIAKANVRGNNNPKTDKIVGYSKAPKNPNKFPDPKSGANSIMRIADAKKKGFKIESAELNEDYFIVQYYDKKGKADTTKFSKFDDASKAKKYLDRANKTSKEGEYKMLKVKGAMEGLEEANVFGTQDNYGSSDSLLAAVNAVVSGQAETVETTVEDQNEIIENGSDEIVESADLEEAFASFSVPIPAQTLSGKKIGGGKTPIVVKARTAREAIQKAAKQLGVDFKMLKTGKVMKEDNTNDDSDDGEGLDKVQPKAVKKKFKDRKDQDIDNDGDVDDSDKFLHKKRKAISKAISKDESKEEDKKDVKSGKKEKVDIKPKLDEAAFKSKYGSRWEAVMEATIKRLVEQQELNEKFTLLKDKDIAPLVLALKDNISVELKDPKNNNLLVTMQTTDDGVQVKYKTGRNTKVGTERSPMPAIRSAVKFLKAKELAFREL